MLNKHQIVSATILLITFSSIKRSALADQVNTHNWLHFSPSTITLINNKYCICVLKVRQCFWFVQSFRLEVQNHYICSFIK